MKQRAEAGTVTYSATELHHSLGRALRDVRAGKTVQVVVGPYREVQAVIVRPEQVAA